MTYASQQDLIDRFGTDKLAQLTDKVNRPATVIDAVTTGKALEDASALIDSYVGKRFDLPLSAVPDILVRFCADIALYYLYGSKAEDDGPVERKYKEALAWLKDVSRGLVQLDDGSGSGDPAAPAGDGGVRMKGNSRPITEETMKGYI